MLNWKRHHITPVGLDMGSTAVRGVQISRHGNTLRLYSALEVTSKDTIVCDDSELESLNRLSMPLDTDSLKPDALAGETEDSSEIKEAQADNAWLEKSKHYQELIRQLFDLGGFKGRDVMIHCPVSHLDMRPISLPSGPEGLPHNAIMGALKHQLAEHVPFPIEQSVVDYHILGHDEKTKQLQLMAITADSCWIERQIQLLKSLKLNCVAVLPMPHALARMVNAGHLETVNSILDDPNERNSTSAENAPVGENNLTGLLDMGYTGSTLIVLYGKDPVFCRRFSFSGSEMTQLLTQHLMIDPAQAERIKNDYGLFNHENACSGSNVLNSAEAMNSFQTTISKTIYGALQSKLDEFIEGLIRSLNYVITQYRNAIMTRLILTGKAAHTPQLDSYMSDKLEVPANYLSCHIIDEILNMLPSTYTYSGTWSMATALALSSIPESAIKTERQTHCQQLDIIPA